MIDIRGEVIPGPSSKPVITVDLSGDGSALRAVESLSALKSGVSFHEAQNKRHPLGIYNLSIGRICNKIEKCSARLERYWLRSPYIRELEKQEELRQEIVDYLELCLYAAAEHVDDIESIASSFFSTDRQYSKSPDVRNLKRAMKPLRDQIASFTNTIKHAQGRLRLCAMEVRHNQKDICFHGFYIEGFDQGVVAPSPVLHGNGDVIFSPTSFLWNILVYLAGISEELNRFLVSVSAVDSSLAHPTERSSGFCNAIISLARLPLYSFDEVHPFTRVTLNLQMDDGTRIALNSSIYGSILDPWSKADTGVITGYSLMMEGDGVSKSFRITQPKKLQLQHWT